MAELASPEPPQVSVGFYSERLTDADLFAAVCSLLLDIGAVPSRTIVVPFERAQAFERIGDLADALAFVNLGSGPAAGERLRQLLASAGSAGRVMQTSFAARPIGTLLVTYEPAAGPDGRHPVAVIASAAPLSLPGGGAGRGAEAIAHWLRELLRAGCERLDPLYAAIIIEGSIPPPRRMSGDGRLGTELFVADRLVAADPRLITDLAAIFQDGAVESWQGGTFLSGWGWFNQAGRTVQAARTMEKRAAERLAPAVVHVGL
jgi:hypothetical protein